MGALSFNYNVFPDPKTSTKFFEYKRFCPSIAYGLKYRRYAALSNASIFNAPVAATKVATGVRLYDLFVEKKEKDTTYFQNMQPTSPIHNIWDIEQKDNYVTLYKRVHLNIQDEEFLHRVILPILWEMIPINKYDEDNFSYMPGYFKVSHKNWIDPAINYIETILPRNDNNVYEGNGYFVPPPNWNTNTAEFLQEIIPYEQQSIILHSNPIPINNAQYPYSIEMHLLYRIERTESGWSIFPHERINRINNDSFSILKDSSFVWNYDYKDINYTDFFICNRDVWRMKIYNNIFGNKSTYTSSKFPIDLGVRNTYIMNIMSLMSQATPDRKEIYFNFSFAGAKALDRLLNIIGDDAFYKLCREVDIIPKSINAKIPNPILNVIEQINTETLDIILNVIEQINTARNDLRLSIFENFNVIRKFYELNAFERIYGSNKDFNVIYDPFDYLADPETKILNYFQKYTLSSDAIPERTIRNDAILAPLSDKITNDMEGDVAKKIIGNGRSALSWYENIVASKDEKVTFKYQGYLLIPHEKTVCELSLADFSIKESKYALVFDDIFMNPIGESLKEFQQIWGKAHLENVIEEGNLKISVQKRQTQTNTLTLEENFDSRPEDMVIYPIELLKGSKKPLSDLPPLITPAKDRQGITMYINVLGHKKRKGMYLPDEKIVKISSNRKGMAIYNHICPIDKDKVSMIIWPTQNITEKTSYDFTIYDDNTNIERTSYSFDIYDSSELIHKIRYGFIIHDDDFVYRESKEFSIINSTWFTYKVPYDINITNYGEHIYKKRKGISLYIQEMLEKRQRDIYVTNNLEGAIKSVYPVAVSHYLKYPKWEELGGFIVPISRVRYEMIINNINDFAKKRYRDAMITEGDFASVLFRPTMLDFGMTLDKIPKDIFLDYINEMLVKTSFKATIEEGIWNSKKSYNARLQYDTLWEHLNPKHLYVEDGIFGFKSDVKGFIYADEWLRPKEKVLMIPDNMSGGIKNNERAELFADEWLDKTPLICYYSYDTWGKTKNDRAFVEPHLFGDVSSKEVYIGEHYTGETSEHRAMLEFGSFAERGIKEAWYENGVFSEKLIKSSAVFKQMDWAINGVHKCDLPPNDFGNWAWVYETPDPFQYDKYGIDELLLPEKDTQYEDFEDLVFDREHMRPRNPLKEIDETKWIAKLPIRHPVGKYEDIGKVYEDSAIKWENYFGIQSSVIRDMSLRYYRIWEKNMFKFSTMTMQQAANLMLEYLWSWIPDYYPLDQLEQAYRAFRLIRWYTECAVINNSQYIISYEYADLAWPDAEHKGICHIPSDLQEYDPANTVDNHNDTMYSDIAPGHLCLRNNPIYTGSNDIWVTFKVKNKRNTTISLSMYNQTGAVNIYLNNKLIDVIHAHGLQKLVYNIHYTGSVNEFKIEKKTADNLDNNFIIGHIRIANQAFKELTIDFDPVHRAGNQPLNEVAQKLVQFAALHDRKDIAYHEMLTKNLGISEVYKMLVKYWKLHHENNWKGKRLTIKQV